MEVRRVQLFLFSFFHSLAQFSHRQAWTMFLSSTWNTDPWGGLMHECVFAWHVYCFTESVFLHLKKRSLTQCSFPAAQPTETSVCESFCTRSLSRNYTLHCITSISPILSKVLQIKLAEMGNRYEFTASVSRGNSAHVFIQFIHQHSTDFCEPFHSLLWLSTSSSFVYCYYLALQFLYILLEYPFWPGFSKFPLWILIFLSILLLSSFGYSACKTMR